MKKLILLFTSISLVTSAFANDVKLIVQKVDNQGVVAGNTYRVYAKMPTADHSLHIVYGDQANPLSIKSTAPFFQNQYASYSAAGTFTSSLEAEPTMKYDSWVTIGYTDNTDNGMWDLGVDFSTFDNGGELYSENGGWFLIPTDNKCSQNTAGLILIAQFTTAGDITGKVNLQGWVKGQQTWRETGLEFNTKNAQSLGCTDEKATNYNKEATYNDGSCNYAAASQTASEGILPYTPANAWDVFPNPLRSNVLNIQFNQLNVKEKSTQVDITDMNGKLIASHRISADAVLPGNRIQVTQDLAAGSYIVSLIQDGLLETKTIVVEK